MGFINTDGAGGGLIFKLRFLDERGDQVIHIAVLGDEDIILVLQ